MWQSFRYWQFVLSYNDKVYNINIIILILQLESHDQPHRITLQKVALFSHSNVFMYILLMNGVCVCLQDQSLGMGTWVDFLINASLKGMHWLSNLLRAC